MSTTGRDYSPWRDAAERYPGVHIERHDIAPAGGYWSEHLRIVLLDSALDRVGRRCALAHEIAHMDVGDRPTELCWFAARQETAADKLAARRLVDVDDLLDVLAWCDDPREVAAELDVTVNVLALRAVELQIDRHGPIARMLSMREAVA